MSRKISFSVGLFLLWFSAAGGVNGQEPAPADPGIYPWLLALFLVLLPTAAAVLFSKPRRPAEKADAKPKQLSVDDFQIIEEEEK